MRKLRRGFVALIALVLVVLLVGAAEPWEKPPAEWTEDDTIALVTHSPWTQEIRLQHATGRLLAELPNGTRVVVQDQAGRRIAYAEPAMPGRDDFDRPGFTPLNRPELVEAVYLVRWSSAGIVQAALERLQELSSTLAEQQAPPAEVSNNYYVLTARVAQPPTEPATRRLDRPLLYSQDPSRPPLPSPPPAVPDLFAGMSPEELKARAELRTSGKLRLKPDRALRHGLGAGEGISFFFPRQAEGKPALPPGTEWAEFVFEGVTGTELKVKFKLKEMQVNGQPDY